MQTSAIEVANLSKTYDNGTQALKDACLDIKSGEIFGLIGANGAGKTTLIRIITTMLHPTGGHVKVFGVDPLDDPELVRSMIGVLPQETGLYEEFTIRENLEFIGEMQGLSKEERSKQIAEVAGFLEISPILESRVEKLSGGMKRRGMIARAMMGNPKILFLDEPTTGLDVLVARSVRKVIRRLAEDITTVLATHNMHEAEELCDRIAIIKDGGIIEIDSPASLLKRHGSPGETFEDVIARLLDVDSMSIEELDVHVQKRDWKVKR